MLSSRLPKSLEPNAVARAIDAKRRSGVADRRSDRNQSDQRRLRRIRRSCSNRSPNPRALEYDPQPLGLWSARAAVAADFRRRGIVISADRVALTSSTSEAYALLFKLLCDAGDAVLVPHPSYPLFEHLTQLESVTAIPYALEYHGAWRIDIDSIATRRHRSRARDPDRVAEQSDRLVPASRRSRRRCRISPPRTRLGDHRRRSVRRLSARSRAGRDQRAGRRRRADLQPRRPVEVRRPAAIEARLDRFRRTDGEG